MSRKRGGGQMKGSTKGVLFRDNQMMHSESLRFAHILQPASHPRPPTIEIVGSGPSTSWLREMNHQLTAKSSFAGESDEAVRVAIRRSRQTKKTSQFTQRFSYSVTPSVFPQLPRPSLRLTSNVADTLQAEQQPLSLSAILMKKER